MKKEKMSTGKKLKILSLIFVGVFIAVNLTWLFGILLPCMKFTKNMEYMNEGLGGYYFYSDDKHGKCFKNHQFNSIICNCIGWRSHTFFGTSDNCFLHK